jgi:hypothetical protein
MKVAGFSSIFYWILICQINLSLAAEKNHEATARRFTVREIMRDSEQLAKVFFYYFGGDQKN